MIPTLDRQGAVWLFVDEVTSMYLNAMRGRTALEIAAGYGHTVVSALEHGARRICANEVDAEQLAIIQSRSGHAVAARRRLLLGFDTQSPHHGRFPSEVDRLDKERP
jgi:predicted RNA methylase